MIVQRAREPNRLGAVMQDNGLDDNALAAATGASRVHIGKIRRGAAHPSEGLKRLLSLVLDVPQPWLFPPVRPVPDVADEDQDAAPPVAHARDVKAERWRVPDRHPVDPTADRRVTG